MVGYSVAPSGRGLVDAVTRPSISPSCPPAGESGNTREVSIYYQPETYGQQLIVGYQTQLEYHDGSCGTYWENYGDIAWVMSGESAGTVYGTYDISLCGVSVNVGSYYEAWSSDGNGGAYNVNINTSYVPYGTLLANCDGYNHFSDENGGYYSEPDGSSEGGGGEGGYPTGSTGNTDSGYNYIYISEVDGTFENGTYFSTEYHDGAGGTYWETVYSYASYGYTFAQSEYYDEGMGVIVNVYYQSDENGGYFTQT